MVKKREEYLILALTSSSICRRRSPNVIKILSLPQSLKILPISLVAKEVAFSLTRPFSDRLIIPYYMLAYKSTVLKNWDDIAVICKDPLTIKKFSDLFCVRIGDAYSINHPLFHKLLLHELNLLRRI